MNKIIFSCIATLLLSTTSALAWDKDFRDLVKTESYEVVEQAIRNGADVNFQPDWETYNVVTITPLISAIYAERNDIVKLLLEYGADPNLYYNKGISPLMEAAYRGNAEAVTILLNNKADINQTGAFGKDTLSYAISGKNLDVIEVLLKNGANVHHQDDMGSTALHKVYGNKEIADLLIKYGADKTIKDRDGLTPEFFMNIK